MPTSNFQPVRLFDPGFLCKFTYFMANCADPDQFKSQLIWIYTVCKERTCPGSAGLRLEESISPFNMEKSLFFKTFYSGDPQKGNWQKVLTKISHHRNAASDQGSPLFPNNLANQFSLEIFTTSPVSSATIHCWH